MYQCVRHNTSSLKLILHIPLYIFTKFAEAFGYQYFCIKLLKFINSIILLNSQWLCFHADIQKLQIIHILYSKLQKLFWRERWSHLYDKKCKAADLILKEIVTNVRKSCNFNQEPRWEIWNFLLLHFANLFRVLVVFCKFSIFLGFYLQLLAS